MKKKEFQILTTVTIEYDGDEDNAVYKALDSFWPTFDEMKNVSVVDYDYKEIDLKSMIKSESMIAGMNKLIFYNFNYSNVNDMIKYITREERYLYEHFKKKFNHLYDVFGCRAALLSFYCELDLKFRREMLDFIINNYNDEQKFS